MFHPLDDVRRERAEADRLDIMWRHWPAGPEYAAAFLGILLAEKLVGLRPPWRRDDVKPVANPLVLTLSRPGRARFAFKPPSRSAAND